MKKIMNNKDSVLCELSHVEFTKLANTPSADSVPDGQSIGLGRIARAVDFFEDKQTKLASLKKKLEQISTVINEAIEN